jgi:hypothetical protein
VELPVPTCVHSDVAESTATLLRTPQHPSSSGVGRGSPASSSSWSRGTAWAWCRWVARNTPFFCLRSANLPRSSSRATRHLPRVEGLLAPCVRVIAAEGPYSRSWRPWALCSPHRRAWKDMHLRCFNTLRMSFCPIARASSGHTPPSICARDAPASCASLPP